MKVEKLAAATGAEFFCGVPDSQLKQLCDYLYGHYGISGRHVIAANEGNCVGLAAGYYLATGKVPVVYMQNSGIGNVVNPVASLLNNQVYAIPCIFIIGWRGEPGVHDEPQHLFQGKITKELLETIGVRTFVLDAGTTEAALDAQMDAFRPLLAQGESVAFIVKKKALETDHTVRYANAYTMAREEVLRQIAAAAGKDVIVSTTGKASRELFEIREQNGQDHSRDFLTVGSMGHASSIALGIALQKKQARVWCVDGDGAALMHMGAMAVIGANAPENLIHVVLNNEAHETVGGMPTVGGKIDLCKVAEGCGYPVRMRVDTEAALKKALAQAKEERRLTFIEVLTALGSRPDLGRPTTTPKENKEQFMRYLNSL